MEFEEKWLEIAERFMGYLEKMVEMEEKRMEFMFLKSKPVKPVSITPPTPFRMIPLQEDIKQWCEGLGKLSDALSNVDEIDKGKGFEHLIVALRIIIDEMRVYLAVNK